MSENVSQFILRRMYEEWDVDRIYGYPGDGINGLLGAFHEHGDKVRFVQTRHEELAAFMACAHAKMTDQVGVCMATFNDEPTVAGARSASDRVEAFADDHHLAAALRGRVARVVSDVIETLAGAVAQPPAPVCIEADIELGNLQLVITHEVDCAPSVEELKPFLAVIGERCDGFAVNRRALTVVEVWACFRLA